MNVKIPGARRLAREFCRAARKRKEGVTIWINKEWPSLGKDFKRLLRHIGCSEQFPMAVSILCESFGALYISSSFSFSSFMFSNL